VVDKAENIPLIDEEDSNDFEQLTPEEWAYEDQKTENFFTNFFSENILAKIWGILIFLGVIFLLTLVWNVIPWVLKIILWFIIGLSTYYAWVKLDQKWLIQEWRILLGLAILINYAVILSGRYIIWETQIDTTPLFSTGISFVFLVFNTVFAVLTALYYKSTPLLIFSFIFAYLNPYMTGIQDTTPYILVWYSIIVSLWALYLSISRKNTWLLIMVFILWNLLIFWAPNLSGNIEAWYIVKFISMIWLTLLSLLAAIKMEEQTKTFIELFFAWAFFLVWFFWLLGSPSEIAVSSYLLSIVASFIFMLVSYFQMHKWPYLFSIWSIWWALVLLSSLVWDKNELIIYSLVTVLAYFILNIYWALKLKIQDNNALKNLVIGTISWILFIAFEIYRYSTINELPLVLLWIFYFILAFVYFWIAYFISHKMWFASIKENVLQQNLLYNFLWISISLVSLAIALIFSEYQYVIPLFWLFESSILLYFFKRIWDIKIFIAGLILMSLWIWELWWSSLWTSLQGSYLYLVTFGLVWISLTLNIIFTKEHENTFLKLVHDLLQILALLILIILVSQIFNTEYSLWVFWILMCGFGFLYKKYWSYILQLAFVMIISLWYIWHIVNVFEMIEYVIKFNHVLQYSVSFILLWAAYMFIKTPETLIRRSQLIAIASIYVFVITSMYVYQIFPNIFSITLYWWALAFMLISRWIWKDIIALRTLWLYLIMLMCVKIFFIDIPYSIDETVIKVVAFIAVWTMLMVISSMYSKKYGNKLKWEYQLSNILGNSEVQKENKKTTAHGETVTTNKKTTGEIDINQKIKDIDISGIEYVTFEPNGGKKFSTKAKNLMRIVVMIMWRDSEESFEANELLDSYKYIMRNYKSDLNERDLTRIKSVVFDFVKKGGTVIIKK
jgi:hypothetical protein